MSGRGAEIEGGPLGFWRRLRSQLSTPTDEPWFEDVPPTEQETRRGFWVVGSITAVVGLFALYGIFH